MVNAEPLKNHFVVKLSVCQDNLYFQTAWRYQAEINIKYSGLRSLEGQIKIKPLTPNINNLSPTSILDCFICLSNL